MEERLRFVARLLDVEATTDLGREFGISRKTGYKILGRYKEGQCRPLRPILPTGPLCQPAAAADRGAYRQPQALLPNLPTPPAFGEYLLSGVAGLFPIQLRKRRVTRVANRLNVEGCYRRNLPCIGDTAMRILMLASMLSLTACGVAGKIDARYRYEDSLAAYTDCLNGWIAAAYRDKHTGDCEQERQVMEANQLNLESR